MIGIKKVALIDLKHEQDIEYSAYMSPIVMDVGIFTHKKEKVMLVL